MPDSTPKDSNEESNQDSVDLSELKSFSFGTQWTEAKSSSGKPSSFKGGSRGGDSSGGRRPGGGGGQRKDRRPPRPQRSAPSGEEGAGRSGPPAERQGQGGGRRPFRKGGRGDGPRQPFRPYESQVFDICFYPEDNCFAAIIKAMRGNHLTYELFHVAKLFMEKPDRFIASVTRKAVDGQKPEKVAICLADNMPFATEEEAISHAIAHYPESYFTVDEVEVEAPSGNFAFVNRCPFTKVLLGPPNYHKYEAALRNHHRTRLPNMPFEKLQTSVETVREEEAVNEWLESQKKATRYTVKEVAEGEEPKVFASVEDATGYLRTDLRAKVVKLVNYARVPGNVLEKFKESEAFKAMDGERSRQQRFPLDTANAIRGRMRREKFSIYKKGAKGVTYVCATKRNFRSPGQVMSPDLDRLIRFVEANQLIKAKEMGPKYEEWLKSESPDTAYDEKKLLRDLHWLVADGYVSHFEDDSLFAQPILEQGASESSSSKEAAPAKSEAKAEAAKPPVPAEAKPAETEAAPETPPVPAASEVVESPAEEKAPGEPAAPTEPASEATAEEKPEA